MRIEFTGKNVCLSKKYHLGPVWKSKAIPRVGDHVELQCLTEHFPYGQAEPALVGRPRDLLVTKVLWSLDSDGKPEVEITFTPG